MSCALPLHALQGCHWVRVGSAATLPEGGLIQKLRLSSWSAALWLSLPGHSFRRHELSKARLTAEGLAETATVLIRWGAERCSRVETGVLLKLPRPLGGLWGLQCC